MEGELFKPEMGDLYFTLGGCGILFALLIFVAVRVGRSKESDPRRRVLLPMLAYFGALLTLMTFLGAFWSTFKYPDVTIGERFLTIDDEQYPLPNVANMRIEAVGRGISTTNKILLLQTKDRKNWAFPDDRYDINRMYAKLRGGK